MLDTGRGSGVEWRQEEETATEEEKVRETDKEDTGDGEVKKVVEL